LINIGAYQKGSSPLIDRAIQLRAAIETLLMQEQHELIPWQRSVDELTKLALIATSQAIPTAPSQPLAGSANAFANGAPGMRAA